MKSKKEITEEEKKQICEEYKDRSINVVEIANRYGIHRGDVTHIAVELGAEPRCAKKYGKTRPSKKSGATVKKCAKCHKTIDVKGASFCCFCGADIRSNRERLIERIRNAMHKTFLLPASERDNIQQLFIDIKAELSKEV